MNYDWYLDAPRVPENREVPLGNPSVKTKFCLSDNPFNMQMVCKYVAEFY